MYSLFLLLFQRSYWRMLSRRATWEEAARSLRRAHRDKRARKHILQVSLLLIVPILCLVYLAWLAGTGAILLVPFLVPVLWWRRRREKQQSASLSILPAAEPNDLPLPYRDCPAVRHYLAELALFYSILLDRAGSESFLKTKSLPEGAEVTSRRVHLDLLRTRNLWDRVAQEDRAIMMMADGHWDAMLIDQVSRAFEPLRLLRWILRVDFYLPVIGQQLQTSFTLAHDLVLHPDKVLVGTRLADMATLRMGKDAATEFFIRCYAEGLSRGEYEAVSQEADAWAKEFASSHRGKQDVDLVLGSEIVSEAPTDDLLRATMLSHLRADFLAWVMSLTEATLPSVFSLEVFATQNRSESAPSRLP